MQQRDFVSTASISRDSSKLRRFMNPRCLFCRCRAWSWGCDRLKTYDRERLKPEPHHPVTEEDSEDPKP